MDNDDKIEQATHKGVQLFLADVLKPLEKSAGTSYDLTAEYAKTRKNHNRPVWYLLAICFAVVVLATVAVTAYVSHSNHQISITIDTFDDLNLKGLLSSVGRTQSLLENAQRQKKALENARDTELLQAEATRDNALFTLESVASVTSKKTLNRRRQEIASAYEAEVDRIHKFYDSEIEAAETEMELHRSQLESYDNTKLSQAKENEAALDSQKQLHDLEMANLTSRYEKMVSDLHEKMDAQQKEAARAQREAVENVRAQYQTRIDELDPLVKDKRGNEVVESALAERADFSAADYSFGVNSATSASYLDSLKDVEANYAELDYIYKIVRGLPQENNIPKYVDSMQKLAVEIGRKMADCAYGLQKNVDSLSAQMEVQKSYYESFIADHQAQGLVLDVTYSTMLPVYIAKVSAPLFEEEESLPAQILEGKRVIAEVLIQKQEKGFFALPKDGKNLSNVHTFQVIRLLPPSKK